MPEADPVQEFHNGRRSPRFYPQDRLLPEYYPLRWIDVLDNEKGWLEAQVTDVSHAQDRIRVHFKGYAAKWDETLDLNDPSQRARVAPLHTHTRPGVRYPTPPLHLHQQLDVLDTLDAWHMAEILNVDGYRKQIYIHYVQYSDKFDEWLNIDSYRIAPLHTHTRPQPPKHRAPIIPASMSIEDAYRVKLFQQKQLRVVDMAPDGNCLFRSISHQVYGTPEYHGVVRVKCMHYIRSQPNFFRGYIDENFEQYVERMKYDGEWGGEIEIRAMGEIYGRPIEIYVYSLVPRRSYIGMNPSAPPIRLSYHWNSHYNSIIEDEAHAVGLGFLTTPPGEHEDRRIRQSALLLDDAAALSAEDREFKLALDVSRRDFANNDLNEFFLNSGTRASIEDENKTIEEAIARSLQAETQMAFDTQSDLEKGIALSLADSKQDIDKELEQAKLLSLLEESKGLTATLPEVPAPIDACVRMGYDRAKVEEAFTLFYDRNAKDDEITSNMVGYLLNERSTSSY